MGGGSGDKKSWLEREGMKELSLWKLDEIKTL